MNQDCIQDYRRFMYAKAEGDRLIGGWEHTFNYQGNTEKATPLIQ